MSSSSDTNTVRIAEKHVGLQNVSVTKHHNGVTGTHGAP
jgi:hypothetical protein